MVDRIVPIGTLRWRVQVCRRIQTPDDKSGIHEAWEPMATVWADVQSVGALTFWSGQQVDTPVTHRIVLRWLDYLSNDHAIIRETDTGGGQRRQEVFRIRRIKEINGRKRFAEIEAELEKAEWA